MSEVFAMDVDDVLALHQAISGIVSEENGNNTDEDDPDAGWSMG